MMVKREIGQRHQTRDTTEGQAYGQPFFGKVGGGKGSTDVMVQQGSHAFFHCVVHNVGNQTVSDTHEVFFSCLWHKYRGDLDMKFKFRNTSMKCLYTQNEAYLINAT